MKQQYFRLVIFCLMIHGAMIQIVLEGALISAKKVSSNKQVSPKISSLDRSSVEISRQVRYAWLAAKKAVSNLSFLPPKNPIKFDDILTYNLEKEFPDSVVNKPVSSQIINSETINASTDFARNNGGIFPDNNQLTKPVVEGKQKLQTQGPLKSQFTLDISKLFSSKARSEKIIKTDSPQPLNLQTNKFTEKQFAQLRSTSGQVTKEQFDFLIEISKSLQSNTSMFAEQTTIGKTYEKLFPDVNKINQEIRNIPGSTFDAMKGSLRYLKDANTTVKRRVLGIKNLQDVKFKEQFAQDFIQSQIGALLGKNSISGQNLFTFTEAGNTKVQDVKNAIINDTVLFSPKSSDVQRLEAIAKHSDSLRNTISNDDSMYRTTFDPTTLNVTTTITKSADVFMLFIDGKTGARTQMYSLNNGETVFDIAPTKSTVTITTTDNNTAAKEVKTLDLNQNDAQQLGDNLMSIASGKEALKTMLWAGKLGIKVATTMVSGITKLTIGTVIVGTMPLLKGASMLAGKKYSDPVITTALTALFKSVVDNNPSPSSAEKGQYFTKNSNLSHGSSKIEIKQQNLNLDKEYFTYEKTMSDIADKALAMAFPKRFGSKLVVDNLVTTAANS